MRRAAGRQAVKPHDEARDDVDSTRPGTLRPGLVNLPCDVPHSVSRRLDRLWAGSGVIETFGDDGLYDPNANEA